MLDIIRDRLAQPDAQDGLHPRWLPAYPGAGRRAHQADARSRHSLDAVVLFDVGAAELVRRLSGRRICALCKRVFNIFTAPPSVPRRLRAGQQRAPVVPAQRRRGRDRAERLRVYEEKTRSRCPAYYSYTGLMRTVRRRGRRWRRSRGGCSMRCAGGPLRRQRPQAGDSQKSAAAKRRPAAKKTAASPQASAPKPARKAEKVVRRSQAPRGAQAARASACARSRASRSRKVARKRAPRRGASQSAANNFSPTTSGAPAAQQVYVAACPRRASRARGASRALRH